MCDRLVNGQSCSEAASTTFKLDTPYGLAVRREASAMVEREDLTKVGELGLGLRGVNVVVKVVSKGDVKEVYSRRDGSTHRVSDVLVGDETGSIILTAWDDVIDRLVEGNTIIVKNGYVSLFRGSMRLNVGRFGSIEDSDVEIGEVNLDNNLSERRYGPPQRSFRQFTPYRRPRRRR